MHAAYQAFKKKLKPTTADIEGPFYRPGAPKKESLTGEPTHEFSGRVFDENGIAIVGALLDVWQADGAGEYDNVGYDLRGKGKTDANGAFRFRTVVPGHYQIGPDEWRCEHLHVKLSAKGFKPLTTQLYFAVDGEFNAKDHWFSADRVVSFAEDPTRFSFDFVLAAKDG